MINNKVFPITLAAEPYDDDYLMQLITNDGNITLDIGLNISSLAIFTIDKDTILDLKGFTIACQERTTSLFNVNKRLEIKDSGSKGKIYISNFISTTANKGVFQVANTTSSKFILTNGIIQVDNIGTSSYPVRTEKYGQSIINGGSIIGNLNANNSHIVSNLGIFNMTRGYIESNNVENTAFDMITIANDKSAKLNLTSGKIKVVNSTSNKTTAVSGENSATMNFSGVELTVKNESWSGDDTNTMLYVELATLAPLGCLILFLQNKKSSLLNK